MFGGVEAAHGKVVVSGKGKGGALEALRYLSRILQIVSVRVSHHVQILRDDR